MLQWAFSFKKFASAWCHNYIRSILGNAWKRHLFSALHQTIRTEGYLILYYSSIYLPPIYQQSLEAASYALKGPMNLISVNYNIPTCRWLRVLRDVSCTACAKLTVFWKNAIARVYRVVFKIGHYLSPPRTRDGEPSYACKLYMKEYLRGRGYR